MCFPDGKDCSDARLHNTQGLQNLLGPTEDKKHPAIAVHRLRRWQKSCGSCFTALDHRHEPFWRLQGVDVVEICP